VHELVTELQSSVNTLHEKFKHHYQPKDVDASGKRKLLTPDRGASPFNRKSNRICSPRGSLGSIPRTESKSARKKCLFSSDTRDDLTGQSSGNSTGTANNVDVDTDSDGWTVVASAVFDHPDEDFEQQLRLAVKLEDSQQRIPTIQ
jgi:hypothetical protein